jgi:glycosyltransferase involved in cell wall biosynthesis
MKILFILRSPFGTIGAAAAYMFPTLASQLGHEVIVLSPNHSTGIDVSPFMFAEKERIKFMFYPPTEKIWKKAWLAKSIIREIHPDIIHTYFDRCAFFFPLCSILLGKKRPRWVLDIRSPLINSGLKRIVAKFVGPIEQIGFDCITTHTMYSAHDVLTIPFKKCIEVPPGVDIRLFNKRHRKSHYKLIRFIYAGSLAKVRKLDILIEGIKLAGDMLPPGKSFKVDFYGKGNAEAYLAAQIERLGLSHMVHMKGLLPQNELFRRMCEYDVGLAYVPGLKTLEYMAASLLVLGSDTAGNRIFVRDGHNGILVKNSPEAIAHGMERAIDQVRVKDYTEHARETVKHYEWQTIVKEKLIPIYQALIQ